MNMRNVFRYTRSNKINVKGFSTNTHSGSTQNDGNNMIQELLLRLGIPIIIWSGLVCYIKIQGNNEMVKINIKTMEDLNKINKEIVQNDIKAIKEMVKIDIKLMEDLNKIDKEIVKIDIKAIKDLIKENNVTSIKMIRAYEDCLFKKE